MVCHHLYFSIYLTQYRCKRYIFGERNQNNFCGMILVSDQYGRTPMGIGVPKKSSVTGFSSRAVVLLFSAVIVAQLIVHLATTAMPCTCLSSQDQPPYLWKKTATHFSHPDNKTPQKPCSATFYVRGCGSSHRHRPHIPTPENNGKAINW